jgi:hypothetical protein
MRVLRTILGKAGAGVIAGLLLTTLPGCFTFTFRDKRFEPGEEHEEWRSFFLFGIVGEGEVNVSEFCPNGDAAEVAVGTNGATWFVSWLTLGIYTPDKVYVTCSAGPAATEEAAAYQIKFHSPGIPERVEKRANGKLFVGAPFLIDKEARTYAVNLREEAP